VNPLLSVSDLSVTFATPSGPLEAVRGVSFELNRSETLAIVGESGSGKSVTALSVLQLLPYPAAWHPSGSVRFEDRELVGASEEALQQIRGDRIAMIFQEPMTSLNPLHRVEKLERASPRAARSRSPVKHQGFGDLSLDPVQRIE
jgi:microcin C transport system ATP-binding protein